MARYADTLLGDGEQIALRTRQHWFATILDGRYPWALLIAGIVILILSTNFDASPIKTGLGYATLALIVVSLLWLLRIYWTWYAQDYIVTNRRVMKVEGIINKHSADSSLEKVNDAVLDQNVIGRMLGYGDLDILTAADVAIDKFRMLDKAPNFKRVMVNMKHDLEGEFNHPPPSPPLRAAAPAPAPAAPAAAPPVAAPPPAPRQMSGDEVTRTLAQLADLRDRGAISPEEYEHKKADLLSRL
jgi:hypothetical protein